MSISLHSRTNHARRRDFRLNALDGTIPAALSALNKLSVLCARPASKPAPVRVRASAGLLVSVRTPACARTHRRTALRVPSPHVDVMYTGSSPTQWPRVVGYSVSFAVPPRVLVLCASPWRVPRTAPSTTPPHIIPRTGP